MRRITKEEIDALYIKHNTPKHVINHCKAVSMVATVLGKQLNMHGYNLDIDLIEGAALSHDVARTSEEHGQVGAKILSDLGYYDEAQIVKVHMYYSPFNKVEELNECDLVCLGDRLVKEDQYVGLDVRIDYILKKAPKKKEIIDSILMRKKETEILLAQIEDIIGIKIDDLFKGDTVIQ